MKGDRLQRAGRRRDSWFVPTRLFHVVFFSPLFKKLKGEVFLKHATQSHSNFCLSVCGIVPTVYLY